MQAASTTFEKELDDLILRLFTSKIIYYSLECFDKLLQ